MTSASTTRISLLQETPGAPAGLQYVEWFRSMRDHAPIWRDPALGAWNVFRYDDAVAIMHNHHTYSSQRQVEASLFEGDIVNMDPPHHDQLRGIVSQVFTPRATAQLEPRIRSITDELLSQIEAGSEMELVEDLAYPLP